MKPGSSHVSRQSERDTHPTHDRESKTAARRRVAHLGTSGVGILSLGLGMAEKFLGLTSVRWSADFFLGFGLALILGSLIFRSRTTSKKGRDSVRAGERESP